MYLNAPQLHLPKNWLWEHTKKKTPEFVLEPD